ncbi:hypothetical protein ADK54_12760 [Streptomyces sp. WM6378]|nr:hypothetical protein ADK54_12760 [Streptomyces sp. WM6378]
MLSTVTAMAIWIGRFAIWPSWIFTLMASTNATGWTRSSGRDCHSAMPTMTLCVIVVMVCLDTSARTPRPDARLSPPCGDPSCGQWQRHFINAGQTALPLLDDLRLEGAGHVARHLHLGRGRTGCRKSVPSSR